MSKKTETRNITRDAVMQKIASVIVRFRFIIFILFAAACVYCFLSLDRVKINSDLTAFLPKTTETRKGLTVMQEEFTSYASARIMVTSITYDKAEELSGKIAEVEHVSDVSFDDSDQHYAQASALFNVSFDTGNEDKETEDAMKEIREMLKPYDAYIDSDIGFDYLAQLADEMVIVLLLAALVIIGVLLFTSKSYFEVVIFAVVFVVAALLNMGTNFWLGEISSITHTIAVILQLALAIDYAIIFAHRYQDEASREPNERKALIRALAKSIVEISSSSLTTIAGLIALTLMQFRLGYDLGIVLSKGIICSMLTVFLLMPGLILLFPKVLRKTAHKDLVPDIACWGRFLMRFRFLFLIIFALILPFAIVYSGRTSYAFSQNGVTEIIHSDQLETNHKINDTFAPSTPIAVLVPGQDYEKEKKILKNYAMLPDVDSVTGLANIELQPGHVITDSYTPREFSELLQLDIETSQLLYRFYGLRNESYGGILNVENYKVPLVDIFMFLFEMTDDGIVDMNDMAGSMPDMGDADISGMMGMMGGEGFDLSSMAGSSGIGGMFSSMKDQLQRGVSQLRGKTMDRIVLTASVPEEGEDSVALVDHIRSIAEKEYGEGNVLVIGDITSARDLHDSYNSDSVLISLLTIVFVFLIILFTFRSPVAAAILVFVIQGSIWINFSFPYLFHRTSFFVTNMIVSAIQMGATIDYAIVIFSRYQTLRQKYEKREAMILTVKESFPTVLTSGAIMSVAGFLIAYRVSDVYVGHIGLAVGRGALISVILVLSVLPQLIVLFDKAIEKTTFKIKLPADNE